MANLKEVRTRIASVSSTQQITSAMKMVSAAKFRRAQNAIIGMRPYASGLKDVIVDIGGEGNVQTIYHQCRPIHRVLILVITSNKGLCGAFNSNILKETHQRIAYYQQKYGDQVTIEVYSIGKKATETLGKRKDILLTSYDSLLDAPSFDNVADLTDGIMRRFADKEIDRVDVVYNQFKNSLSQVLSCEQLLPIEQPSDEDSVNKVGVKSDYIFEPSKAEILSEIIPLTLRSVMYRMILDSLASEHGARMTAMQKATDNATELLKELRLSYNKARQAAITNEIIEIVSGSEALKG